MRRRSFSGFDAGVFTLTPGSSRSLRTITAAGTLTHGRIIKGLTLADLWAEKQRLIAWLGADGHPPTVFVETVESRRCCGKNKEERPVVDGETFDAWWAEWRDANAQAWRKSALNRFKPQTPGQWLSECLSLGLGIKGGTLEDRIARAISSARPYWQRNESKRR